MKASLFIILFAFLVGACSSRPTPKIVSRNYQDNTIVKRVYVGSDSYGVVRFRETGESARQRLLVSIQAECPNYQILQEGQDSDKNIGVIGYDAMTPGQLTPITGTVEAPFYWVRYQCR